MKNSNTQLGIGMTGVIVAAVCVFTPGPAIVLDVAGYSGIRDWLDPALFAALFGFLGLLVYGAINRVRATPRQRGQTPTPRPGYMPRGKRRHRHRPERPII